jgi:chitinase
MPTTILLTPITTGTVNYYNWNISVIITFSMRLLVPGIEIPLVIVTYNPNPPNETGATHSPLVTRTVSNYPWPWATDGI